MGVLTTKPVEQCISDTEVERHQLRRDLSALDLTVFGVGVTIGTGIFVLTGVAAATKAGPAIALSFVVAGIACALAVLACLFLMLNLGTHTWLRFLAWMAIGLVVYFLYGRRRSRVTAGGQALPAGDGRGAR